MKRKSFQSMACLAMSACLMTSCIGSFSLINKVRDWNMQISSEKFLNEVIFIALHIVPVYEICGLVDILVLNSVEFWTGNNPVAKNVGKTKSVMGSDGLEYTVTYLKDGYEIKNPEGEVVNFVFDKKEKTWAVETEQGKVTLLKMKDNHTAQLYLENGETMDVTLDAQGLQAARAAVGNSLFYAAR